MTRPTRTEVSAWIRDLAPETDRPILEAAALIADLRSDMATPAQMSRARAIAREILYTTCRSNRADRTDRTNANERFSRVITSAVDPSGAFYSTFKDLLTAIREPRDADRLEYLASTVTRRPDARTPLQRAYDAECAYANTLYELSRQA